MLLRGAHEVKVKPCAIVWTRPSSSYFGIMHEDDGQCWYFIFHVVVEVYVQHNNATKRVWSSTDFMVSIFPLCEQPQKYIFERALVQLLSTQTVHSIIGPDPFKNITVSIINLFNGCCPNLKYYGPSSIIYWWWHLISYSPLYFALVN